MGHVTSSVDVWMYGARYILSEHSHRVTAHTLYGCVTRSEIQATTTQMYVDEKGKQ